jgi:hypothetical protein
MGLIFNRESKQSALVFDINNKGIRCISTNLNKLKTRYLTNCSYIVTIESLGRDQSFFRINYLTVLCKTLVGKATVAKTVTKYPPVYTTKIQRQALKYLSLIPTCIQLNSIHTFIRYVTTMHFNIIPHRRF